MARWTDLAPWRGPTINEGDGDGTPLEAADAVKEVRGLVVHIAEGYFEGTISWEKNPDANVSSHFVSGRAGGRAQVVDTHDRAWTQSSGNPYWLSVENEGFTLGHRYHKPGWERLTPQQIEFNAHLLARIHREYGVPLKLATSPSDRGLAYHSLGAENGVNWGHSDCPGEAIKAQLPDILARAIEIVNGGDEGMLAKCKLGDKGQAVIDLQEAVVARGGSVGTRSDGSAMIDGDYGAKTAAGLASLVGGDGAKFGVAELLKLTGGAGKPGDPGPAGKTPTKVRFSGELVGEVIEYAGS